MLVLQFFWKYVEFECWTYRCSEFQPMPRTWMSNWPTSVWMIQMLGAGKRFFVGIAAWSVKYSCESLHALPCLFETKTDLFWFNVLPISTSIFRSVADISFQRNSDGKRCVPCAKSDVSWRSTARATVTCLTCHGLGPRRAESLAWRGAQRSSGHPKF